MSKLDWNDRKRFQIDGEAMGRGMDRRAFIFVSGLALGTGVFASPLQTEAGQMYGLIGKLKTIPDRRDNLIQILLEGVSGTGEGVGMRGCLSYVVARDPSDPDAIWITEVWESKESHAASLELPSVAETIAKGRPLIAGFGERYETTPVGGVGLAQA